MRAMLTTRCDTRAPEYGSGRMPPRGSCVGYPRPAGALDKRAAG
jgi:hypothetical protein